MTSAPAGRRGGAVDRLVVGGDRLGIALLVAQNIAKLHFGGDRVGLFGRDRLQLGDRLIGTVERVEIDRAAQPRR